VDKEECRKDGDSVDAQSSTPVPTRKLRHVIPLGPPRATCASDGPRRARPSAYLPGHAVPCGRAAQRGDGPCSRTCRARDRRQMPFINIDHVSKHALHGCDGDSAERFPV